MSTEFIKKMLQKPTTVNQIKVPHTYEETRKLTMETLDNLATLCKWAEQDAEHATANQATGTAILDRGRSGLYDRSFSALESTLEFLE